MSASERHGDSLQVERLECPELDEVDVRPSRQDGFDGDLRLRGGGAEDGRTARLLFNVNPISDKTDRQTGKHTNNNKPRSHNGLQ